MLREEIIQKSIIRNGQRAGKYGSQRKALLQTAAFYKDKFGDNAHALPKRDSRGLPSLAKIGEPPD